MRSAPLLLLLLSHLAPLASPFLAPPLPPAHPRSHRLPAQTEGAFFDSAPLNVAGGRGGNGCVAMRREKGMPLGGPCGGSGGRGGDIVLLADKTINTLSGARQKVHYRGAKGTNGVGKGKDGMHARDTVVKVPLGTIVRLGAGQDGPVCGEVRRGGAAELLVAAALR